MESESSTKSGQTKSTPAKRATPKAEESKQAATSESPEQTGQPGVEPTTPAQEQDTQLLAEKQAEQRPADQQQANAQTITRTIGDALGNVTLPPAESEEDARRREQGIEASKAALKAEPDLETETPRTPGVTTDAVEPRGTGEDGNMQPVTPTADNKTSETSVLAGPGVAVGDEVIVVVGGKKYSAGVIAVHPTIESTEDPAMSSPARIDVKVFTGNPARAGYERIEGIPVPGTEPQPQATRFGGAGTTEGTPAPRANA